MASARSAPRREYEDGTDDAAKGGAVVIRSADGSRWVRIFRGQVERIRGINQLRTIGATLEPVTFDEHGASSYKLNDDQ